MSKESIVRIESYKSRCKVRIRDPSTEERANRKFMLRDGRVLAVAEAGDPKGLPVFLFYGLGASRYFVFFFDEVGRKLRLRLICPDRPGRGLSSNQENRSFMGWAEDVEQVAAQMRLKCYGMWGFSVGALHALACATYPPVAERMVGNLVIAAPWVPTDTPGSKRKVRFLKYLPKTAQTSLPYIWQKGLKKLTERHKKVLEEDYDGRLLPEDELYFCTEEEARRQGGGGFATEFSMCCMEQSDLGFNTNGLLRPIKMYAGSNDSLVSIQASRLFALQLPNCEYVEVPFQEHNFFMKLSAVDFMLSHEVARFWKEAEERFDFRHSDDAPIPTIEAETIFGVSARSIAREEVSEIDLEDSAQSSVVAEASSEIQQERELSDNSSKPKELSSGEIREEGDPTTKNGSPTMDISEQKEALDHATGQNFAEEAPSNEGWDGFEKSEDDIDLTGEDIREACPHFPTGGSLMEALLSETANDEDKNLLMLSRSWPPVSGRAF